MDYEPVGFVSMDPKFQNIVKEIRAEFDFQIVPKEGSGFMRFLYTVLFMKYWNQVFLTDFTTVMTMPWGKVICWMPTELIGTHLGYMVLRHERVHARDSRGWMWLPYVITYLLLPVGPSGRAYWELRGYKESMRVHFEEYGHLDDWYIEFIANQFTGSYYLWMFPFPKTIRRILNRYREEIENGR